MKTYAITDLLWFWMQESNDDFKVIKSILKVIGDENVPDSEKRELVIEILRYYGLYEVGFVGDRTINLDGLMSPEQPSVRHQGKDALTVPMELYKCKIMNADIQFQSILN